MYFNPQVNTNKNATQFASYNPAFMSVKKGAVLMNSEYESKFVKLLSDYAEFKESDKEFGVKFAKLSKDYVKEQRPTVFPEWFKNLFIASQKVNDNDIEGIAARSAITSADYRYLVLKTLRNFVHENKYVNLIKKDYSQYINIDPKH